jgi:hypothetical protein
MSEIMAGDATPAQIGAFMLALRAKGETVAELAGLVDVMLQNAVVLDTGSDALDIVGTGGDLVGTVNISSMASVVAAASGIPVLKHGSRSASGKTGSSEMLEMLGIRLDLAPQQVTEVFKRVGITFFFAPVFHPAMRHVAPIRKELAQPTDVRLPCWQRRSAVVSAVAATAPAGRCRGVIHACTRRDNSLVLIRRGALVGGRDAMTMPAARARAAAARMMMTMRTRCVRLAPLAFTHPVV